MEREFKGRHFRQIDVGKVNINVPLSMDLFVFLPLNFRMFRIRESGQEIDQQTIDNYVSKASVGFFILDPIKHFIPGYILEGNGIASTNPGIPIEMAQKLAQMQAAHAAQKVKEEEATESMGGENNSLITDIDFAKKIADRNQEEAGKLIAPDAKDEEENRVAGSPGEEEATEVVSGEFDEELKKTKVSGGKDKEKFGQIVGGALAEELDSDLLKGQRAQAEKGMLLASETAKLDELKFGKDKATTNVTNLGGKTEEDGSVNLSSAESDADMLRLIKAEKETGGSFTSRISADIDELENKISASDAGSWNIRTDANTQSKSGNGAVNWKIGLADDSQVLQGLSKEGKAAAKFSHAIGGRLGQLRSELNSALKEQPADEAAEQELNQRKSDLQKQIKKLETATLLMESVDDLDLEVSGLPDELQGKSKLDLLSHLQQEIKDLQNSALLSNADAKLLDRKLNEVKAENFGVHGESIDKLKGALESRLKKVKETGKEMNVADRDKINQLVAKNVRQTKIAANIQKDIAAKREELSELLDQKPANREERKKNEAKATKLQQEIRDLEDLCASVEGGDPVPSARTQKYDKGVDEEFKLKPDENTEEGMERVLNWLTDLKKDLNVAKSGAASAKERLLTKINGVEKKIDDQPIVPGAPSAKLSTALKEKTPLLAKLETFQENLNTTRNEMAEGKEITAVQLSRTQKDLMEDVKRASISMNMDVKLNQLRKQLGNVIDKAKSNPKEKAKIEKEANALLKKIQAMEKAKNSLAEGAALDDDNFREFTKNHEQGFALRKGESPDSAMNRIIKSLDEFKDKAAKVAEEAEASRGSLFDQIKRSDLTSLKQDIVGSPKIEKAKLKLARYVEFFLENGRELEPEDLWQIKKLGVKALEEAVIEINIGTEIIALDKEIQILKASKPETEHEQIIVADKIEKLSLEIMELKKLGDCISRGEEVEEILIKPFRPKNPEEFLFENGVPVPGFEDYSAEEKRFKPMEPKALEEHILRDRPKSEKQKAEENEKIIFKVDQKIKNFNHEITLIKERVPKNEEEAMIFKKEIEAKNDEIQKLTQVAEIIVNGGEVSDLVVQGIKKEIREDEFRFKKDKKSTVDQIRHVLDSLKKVEEKFITVKKEEIAVTDTIVFKADSEEEKEFKKTVSGIDAKMGQAGVYAATLLQSMGYENEKMEEDIITASYLWNSPQEEVAAAFPGRVSAIHTLAHQKGESEDMVVQDLAQTLQVVCNFIHEPDVITGKFSIDSDVFSRYCEKLENSPDSSLDFQLLERVRQATQKSIHDDDRKRLVSVSRIVYQNIGKWKQSKAQAEGNTVGARTTFG